MEINLSGGDKKIIADVIKVIEKIYQRKIYVFKILLINWH